MAKKEKKKERKNINEENKNFQKATSESVGLNAGGIKGFSNITKKN